MHFASFGPLLRVLRGYATDLFDTVVLDPAGVDAMLAAFHRPPAFWRWTGAGSDCSSASA